MSYFIWKLSSKFPLNAIESKQQITKSLEYCVTSLFLDELSRNLALNYSFFALTFFPPFSFRKIWPPRTTGSLSTRVFETRTATGREHFACQDRGVSHIFILIIPNGEKVLSNVNVIVRRRVIRENSALPLAVRVSKSRVLKLPNDTEQNVSMNPVKLEEEGNISKSLLSVLNVMQENLTSSNSMLRDLVERNRKSTKPDSISKRAKRDESRSCRSVNASEKALASTSKEVIDSTSEEASDSASEEANTKTPDEDTLSLLGDDNHHDFCSED